MTVCIFCEIPSERIEVENELVIAIKDAFPVSEGHTLIIPRRHVSEYFALTAAEIKACNELMLVAKDGIGIDDPLVNGFNIGVNVGSVAGQTIFHCHIHLIPRREGDVDDPRGGVRHLMPGKGYYEAK